ncbi:hypothetical protein HZA42_04520 [Candidatus Peregrinibacteria bacterium]|nr:hypothetical protein [Candidatus Peregrinibacteria bacterium]
MTTVAATIISGVPMSHTALALGIVCLLLALPAFFDPKKFKAAMEEFFSAGKPVMRLTAFVFFGTAFFILNSHWSITKNARGLLTVLGYLLVLKGICWLWFPGWISKMKLRWLQKPYMPLLAGGLLLLIGVGLAYLGIWVY